MNKEIKKLISDFIEDHADEIESIIRTALAERKSMRNIKAGDHFEYKGIEWVCLDVLPTLGALRKGVFAISAKTIANMPFNDEYEDGCNNWRTSSLRKWLNGEFLDKNFDKGALLANFSTLTADNGDDKYGAVEDYVTLLDCDQYRKYRKFMPKYDDWVWTLPPRSCTTDDYAYHVRGVYPSRDLSSSHASIAHGVTPACVFNLNYLSSCRQARIITHKRGISI